jgi:hypothetical protein
MASSRAISISAARGRETRSDVIALVQHFGRRRLRGRMHNVAGEVAPKGNRRAKNGKTAGGIVTVRRIEHWNPTIDEAGAT